MSARIVPLAHGRSAHRDLVMEHRWSPRTECELPVLVRCRNSWCMGCTITNANKTGLCLNTGPIHLMPGAVVELVLDSAAADDASSEPLVAMVIHSAVGRAGLWLGDDPLQYEKLQAFIGSHPHP